MARNYFIIVYCKLNDSALALAIAFAFTIQHAISIFIAIDENEIFMMTRILFSSNVQMNKEREKISHAY